MATVRKGTVTVDAYLPYAKSHNFVAVPRRQM